MTTDHAPETHPALAGIRDAGPGAERLRALVVERYGELAALVQERTAGGLPRRPEPHVPAHEPMVGLLILAGCFVIVMTVVVLSAAGYP